MRKKDGMSELLTIGLEPELLTNKSRLKEIYDLRVKVWENSEKSKVVNSRLFQNGWYDELDEAAYHWIITNEQDVIIASARLNIFNDLESYPYNNSLKRLDPPDHTPFGFCGRLVVHPRYQGMHLSTKLISSRISYCKKHNIRWLHALVSSDRITNKLDGLNFKMIGQMDVNYHESTHPHTVNVLVKDYQLNKQETDKWKTQSIA